MLSFPDIAILSGLALIVFGPEKLPQIARQVGQITGALRQTSNAFVREMERAGDLRPISSSVQAANIGPLSDAPSRVEMLQQPVMRAQIADAFTGHDNSSPSASNAKTPLPSRDPSITPLPDLTAATIPDLPTATKPDGSGQRVASQGPAASFEPPSGSQYREPYRPSN